MENNTNKIRVANSYKENLSEGTSPSKRRDMRETSSMALGEAKIRPEERSKISPCVVKELVNVKSI